MQDETSPESSSAVVARRSYAVMARSPSGCAILRAMATTTAPPVTRTPRHAALVRVTHWIAAAAFLALLLTGAEIVISHPRFYWGETGNVNMKPLLTLPIPSSRESVPTNYKFGMPDENGWSRYLHFEAAWVLVLTGLVYVFWGFATGHFRRNFLPERQDRSFGAVWARMARYLRRAPPDADEARAYNVLQRWAYLAVVFVLIPFTILTGLALSPSFNSAVPVVVDTLGGRQSARTLHFFLSWALFFFLVAHVTMVAVSGFRARMRAMMTGRGNIDASDATGERP
jgi:thiosulfate reductase cytochrome b subunit